MQRYVELSKTPTDVNNPCVKNVNNDDDDNNDDNNNDDNNNNIDNKDKGYKGVDDEDEDNNDDDGDDDDGGGNCGPGEKPSMRVMPGQGLYYREDDALLDEVFDDDYNEKHFTLIPSEAACDRNCNHIAGGPQRPMNPSKLDKWHYKVSRKSYTDNQRRKLLKMLVAVDMNLSPQKEKQMMEYTGDQYPHIHLINVVEQNRLMTGHTFAEKTTLEIRIGEEANLCNIKTRVMKSCKMQYFVAGDRFYVKALHLIYEGWKVHTCICRENDDTLCIPMGAMYINKKSIWSPFTSKWIGHILWSHLEMNMRSLTENYAHGHLTTDKIL